MKGAEGLLVRLEKQGKQEDRMMAIEAPSRLPQNNLVRRVQPWTWVY